jgi:hypothetical protein
MQNNKAIKVTVLLGLCLCGAARANDADSLFFLAPRSATGYSGTGVRKMGEQLPPWIPSEKIGPAKASAEKPSAAEKSSTMVSIGYSNLGWSLTLTSYPDKIITFATSFAYFHESTNGKLLLKNAVADSLRDSMAVHSVQAPFSVTQETSLYHVRLGYGIRFNFLPFLKSSSSLPFPINPYIGVGAVVDVSSGSTVLRPVDSLGRASSSFDTSFGGFDTTVSRINADIAFAFPIGLEIFPFKNSTIPIIKNLGVSFVYTIYATYRVFAMPSKDLNPYQDYIDQLSGSNNTNNSPLPSGPQNGYPSADSSSSGGNGSGGNGFRLPWFGWSPVSSKNEFRVSLDLMF